MTKNTKSHSERKTLTEWLSYLENIHSVEIDLGLARISEVAKRLNIQFEHSTVITVAGTNGKGTTCAFLENALLASSKTVAVYSSPHIEHFNERLRINRQDINDTPLILAFEKIESARQDISLSYYEYTTLAAFLILMDTKPDVIILEVGLGGRLDATNIIDADIAVITTIDLDHQAFLGDTRELIGYEKAGIFRAHKVAVIGDTDVPQSIIDHANTLHSDAYYRGQDFHVENTEQAQWQWHNQTHSFEQLNKPYIPLDNVATALNVLSLLESKLMLSLTQVFINDIIASTKVPGRNERFVDGCHIVLDVGHNPQAARYLASQLSRNEYTNITAVLGMLSDKDAMNTIAPLKPIVSQWNLGSLNVPRGCTADELAKNFVDDKTVVNCFDNVSQAFKMAKINAKPTDLILVFGSFFTVSEIRRLLVV